MPKRRACVRDEDMQLISSRGFYGAEAEGALGRGAVTGLFSAQAMARRDAAAYREAALSC